MKMLKVVCITTVFGIMTVFLEIILVRTPIGLASGEPNFYAYVKDSNSWVDIFGLSECNLKGRNTPAWKARGWQGSGDYPGIDKWRTKNLKKGSIVYGGVPGQSEFYLSQKSLNLANGSKERLWKSAQVKPHDIYGYRSQVQAYEVLEDVDIGFSIVEANMQHGAGKAEQIFIENFGKVLKPIGNPIPLI